MIDLTKKIINSVGLNVLWKIQGFYLWKECFEKLGYQTSFWEHEENWATILQEGEIAGYIWQDNPLIILKEDISKIQNHTSVTPAEILIHSNFSEKIFCIDHEIRESYFPHLENPFSIDDLWFYSNSL